MASLIVFQNRRIIALTSFLNKLLWLWTIFRVWRGVFHKPWNPAAIGRWTIDACSLTLPDNKCHLTARYLWRHFPLPCRIPPPPTRDWSAARWPLSSMLTIFWVLSPFWFPRPRLHSRCCLRARRGHSHHCSHFGRCIFHSLSATDARICRCCPGTPQQASPSPSQEGPLYKASSEKKIQNKSR